MTLLHRARKIGRTFAWSIAAWIIALGIYLTIVLHGRVDAAPESWATHPAAAVLVVLAMGVLWGVLYGAATLAGDHRALRHRSFAVLIAFKVAVMVLGTIGTAFLVAWANVAVGLSTSDDYVAEALATLTSIRVIPFFLYVGAVAGVLSFARETAIMVGPRVLWNVVRGHYHRPRSEDRVFMFLDLQGSTTHAERLGRERYCKLIQDCFRDLTDAAVRRDVEVYQYVGDEAVLTWTPGDARRDANCLHVFFDFAETLRKRAPLYTKRYGVVPRFKAGLNAGPVMAAEVGVVKREIVYLSETLHVGARIQGKCNELGRQVLLSRAVRDLVPDPPGLTYVPIGEVDLRGREGTVEIFGVDVAG